MRYYQLAMIAATFAGSVALYALKYDTSKEAAANSRLRVEIASQREAIRILEAEWSLLNQPDRLQKLAERHLKLGPLQPEQIVDFSAIPKLPENDAVANLVRLSTGGAADKPTPDRIRSLIDGN